MVAVETDAEGQALLLDRLLHLRVPLRLFDAATNLVAAEICVFDTRGTLRPRAGAGPRARCFALREGPKPARWPPCLPPVEQWPAGWLACGDAREQHLVVPIVVSGSLPIGWIVTGDIDRGALSAERVGLLEWLLGAAVEEMRAFARTRPLPSRALARAVEFPEFLGESAAARKVRGELRRVLDVPFPVLIEGETGTGKDLAAWLIHDRGARRAGPYVTLNCAAMPEALVESELFGHRRGAFTGANRDRAGLLVAAREGTLFLDEVADLSPAAQAKLLRAIETGEVLPVGASKPEHTDARIMAATNIDLETEARAGRFRLDLFYRLRVLYIRMPALRERCDDIPLLAANTLQGLSKRLGIPPRRFSRAALAALTTAAWPGNVRQLIHEIERAVVSCDEEEIGLKHLSQEFQTIDFGPELSFLMLRRRLVEGWERAEIRRGLEETGWNVARLARQMRISERALFLRIKRYGLNRPARRDG